MPSVPHFLSSSSLSLSLPLAYFLLSSPFSPLSPLSSVSLSLPITLLVTTPPHLSYSHSSLSLILLSPHPRLPSSLTSNDHSSTLQGPVPFSAACSLLQPVQGSPFLPSPLLSSSRHPPHSTTVWGGSSTLVCPNDRHLSPRQKGPVGVSDNVWLDSALPFHPLKLTGL